MHCNENRRAKVDNKKQSLETTLVVGRRKILEALICVQMTLTLSPDFSLINVKTTNSWRTISNICMSNYSQTL